MSEVVPNVDNNLNSPLLTNEEEEVQQIDEKFRTKDQLTVSDIFKLTPFELM